MILKDSRMFYILALVVLNLVYISLEIYKSRISEPLLGKSGITNLEFIKVETLSSYAYFFEIAFLIVSIIWTLLLFLRKYRFQFKKLITIQLSLLVFIFIFNYALSWIFSAPSGNLTQLLLGPIAFIIGAVIYFIFSNVFSKLKKYNAGNDSA